MTNPAQAQHANCLDIVDRFAQQAYRAGRDVEAVRMALGHASVTTTQLYLHASADEVVEACRGAWIDGRLAAA
jgi:site-specific recombinase XerD